MMLHAAAVALDGFAAEAEGSGEIVPDFSLEDVNPDSATSGQPFSPRDYLEQVSGWFFSYNW
jgi:hypothetical protein